MNMLTKVPLCLLMLLSALSFIFLSWQRRIALTLWLCYGIWKKHTQNTKIFGWFMDENAPLWAIARGNWVNIMRSNSSNKQSSHKSERASVGLRQYYSSQRGTMRTCTKVDSRATRCDQSSSESKQLPISLGSSSRRAAWDTIQEKSTQFH